MSVWSKSRLGTSHAGWRTVCPTSTVLRQRVGNCGSTCSTDAQRPHNQRWESQEVNLFSQSHQVFSHFSPHSFACLCVPHEKHHSYLCTVTFHTVMTLSDHTLMLQWWAVCAGRLVLPASSAHCFVLIIWWSEEVAGTKPLVSVIIKANNSGSLISEKPGKPNRWTVWCSGQGWAASLVSVYLFQL